MIYSFVDISLHLSSFASGLCKFIFRLSFASVEIDKSYSFTLPSWKNLCHRWSRDQPRPGSLFPKTREAEERDPGNEVDLKADKFKKIKQKYSTQFVMSHLSSPVVGS